MIWSFYDMLTGVFSGRRYDGPDKFLERNTPTGFAAIEGVYDPVTQLVDPMTKQVISQQTEIIVAKRENQRKINSDRNARSRLVEIDIKMVRPLVALIKDPTDAAALVRLAELEALATDVRKDIIPTPEEIEITGRLP